MSGSQSCDRCRITYVAGYERRRCEECGGMLLPWPETRVVMRWPQVRPASVVAPRDYDLRVRHADQRLAAAAAGAQSRFRARALS